MRSLLAFLTLATAASADDLTLRNGATFTGVVREQGDKVTIETDYGSMTFRKIDVRSVVKGRDPVGDFDAKIRVASSTRELAAVAAWALDNGLPGRAQGVFRSILARDPDHAEARRGLGFEKIDGRWLTGDELQIARGLAKFDGRWIPKEEAERLLEERAAAQAEADRLEAERRMVRLPPPPAPPYQEQIAPQYWEPEPLVVEHPAPYPPYSPPCAAPPPCLPQAPPLPVSMPSILPAPTPPVIFQTPPLRISSPPGNPIQVRSMRIESK